MTSQRKILGTDLTQTRFDKSRQITANLRLNGYAWALLTCNPKKMRNPEIALSYAKQAVQKSNEQDANTLDTLAWAYFYTNQRVQAIETEKKASALVENQSSQFKEFNQNIEKFKVSIDK